MAYYDVAYGKQFTTQFVKIIATETIENYVVYVIQVTLNNYYWTVRHRYSHFSDLHEHLCRLWKLDKSLLPPKKLFGNNNENFIQKRKIDLEIYLHSVIKCLPTIPMHLSEFLDFPVYELREVVKSLARDLFLRGDSMLALNKNVTLSPFQLHALCERLQLAVPPCDSENSSEDLSHVVDFLDRLKQVRVRGSEQPVAASNISPNQLYFDFLRFKHLRTITVIDCNTKQIKDISTIRKTLENLEIHCSMNFVKDFLLCDVTHPDADDLSEDLIWPQLKTANFSKNRITSLDKSIKLLKPVEKLNLSWNQLSEICYLECLPALRYLDLSFNRFHRLDQLHTRLGNIVELNLADNRVEELSGFSKLYSLHSLDLTANRVVHVSQVEHLSRLPCLENLSFVGNPVTVAIDYRTKVLELFAPRSAELCLDNEFASMKELDTVAVRVALKRAKHGSVSIGNGQ